MAEFFGTMFEPEGIGSMPTCDCSLCYNINCVEKGKKVFRFCNDFVPEDKKHLVKPQTRISNNNTRRE